MSRHVEPELPIGASRQSIAAHSGIAYVPGCTAKHRYVNHADMKKAIKSLKARGGVAKLYHYRCGVCGFYHLTKRKQETPPHE